jgi:aminomethyltransferase
LKWALKLDKPEFVGKEALAEQLALDNYSRVVGLVMEGRAPAREGYTVWHQERIVGSICSGSIAPSVQNKNIATALVAPEAAAAGTALEVEIRGKRHAAAVVALPFYKRPK